MNQIDATIFKFSCFSTVVIRVGVFLKCSIVPGSEDFTKRRSSYDNDDSDFETVIHRRSKRTKARSPLLSKRIINSDLDFDSPTSSKPSKQEYNPITG